MRYLGIDLGDKRTGLALGDDETRLASPWKVVECSLATPAGVERLLGLLAAAAAEAGRVEVVLGLPLNMDGSEGSPAARARDIGARLAARTGLRVHYQDERLSTAAADWRMSQSGLSRQQKKERRDALAAAEVLSEFLRGLPERPESGRHRA